MASSINRLITAQAFRSLCFSNAIQTLFLLGKGLSLTQIFTLSSILLITGMVFEVPTGLFADRYGRKWSMVTGSFVSVIAWALWIFYSTFGGFVIIFILFGLARAFWSGSDEALIYDELKATGKEASAQKIFSRYNGILALAFTLSALIAGFVAQLETKTLFTLLNQLTLIAATIGFLITLTIQEKPHTSRGNKASHERQNIFRQFSNSLHLLKTNRKLRRIVFFSTFTLSLGLIDIYQVYFTQATIPTAWFGYTLALSSALLALTQWNAYRLEAWFGVEKSMLITTLLPAFFWIAMAFTIHPFLAIMLFLANDTAGNVRYPIITDYQNRHIEGPNRATVLSTISLFKSGYEVLLLPVIGLIAERSLHAAFLTSAGLILVGFFIFRLRAEDVVVAG